MTTRTTTALRMKDAVIGMLVTVNDETARNPGGYGRITARSPKHGKVHVDSGEFPGQEVTGWYSVENVAPYILQPAPTEPTTAECAVKTFSVCPEARQPTIRVNTNGAIETLSFRRKAQADKKIMELLRDGYTFDATRQTTEAPAEPAGAQLCTCPRCGHPAQHETTPHGEGYITCGHCAAITFDPTADDDPAAGAVYCAVCEGLAAPPAYSNGMPLCEACAIAQDEPVSEFYAAAQPPTPACHCGAPATILVREGLTLHDLCDTCFQRDFKGEERHTAWEVMEPPPHATMDEVVEWAYARRHVPLADEERYTHMHAPAPPEISDEEAIRIEALALLDAGADYCTVCGLSHRPTQCPEIGALLFRSAPAPLSPVEALRLAINKGVFGESTLAILRASLEAADEEALIKAEQLASAREHAGQTWETWQEERAAGAPF